MRIFIPIEKRSCKKVFLLLFILFNFVSSYATGAGTEVNLPDSSRQIVIHAVIIEGNRQTRPSIILRELSFKEKDTVRQVPFRKMLIAGKENIFNTALFNFVTVDTVSLGGYPVKMDVVIRVIERWYIWPWPFFEISDRNFNTWIGTTDLSRLSYGIDLTIQNVRGRNETLKFPIHYGFNQKLGFSYRIPYLDRKKIFGIAVGAEFSRNHEVIVETHNNKTVYYKSTGTFPRQNLFVFADLLLRPTFYSRHTLRLSFNSWYFSDSLLKIPDYTVGTNHLLSYFSLYYQFKNDHRDVQFYPLEGSYFDFEIDQNGLWHSPVNELFIKTNVREYVQVFKRIYFALGFTMKATLSPLPPYFLQRGLGYGRDFVRGYEYYVIDGNHYILWKNNLKFALVPQRDFTVRFIRSPKFGRVPFALYLNVFGDAGYVWYTGDLTDTSNDLRNSLLVGYGAGLDLTTYYDIVIGLAGSVTLNGIPGIYVHFIAPI
jgi:outer membrane protein assembly factor BamA